MVEVTITREFRVALQSLDDLNLVEVFARRPSGMRSVPKFFRGCLRNALRVAIKEASVDLRRGERGWKLLLMLARMLLFKHPVAAALQEALIKARAQAQVRPIQVRVSQTEAFLSRSRKKLEVLTVEAEKIKANMQEVEARILDGERRLEALQSEARAQPSPFTVDSDPQEEIRRSRIAQLEASQSGACVQELKRPKLSACSLDLVLLGDPRHWAGASMFGAERAIETDNMCQ